MPRIFPPQDIRTFYSLCLKPLYPYIHMALSLTSFWSPFTIVTYQGGSSLANLQKIATITLTGSSQTSQHLPLLNITYVLVNLFIIYLFQKLLSKLPRQGFLAILFITVLPRAQNSAQTMVSVPYGFSMNKCLPFTNFTLTSPNDVYLFSFSFY